MPGSTVTDESRANRHRKGGGSSRAYDEALVGGRRLERAVWPARVPQRAYVTGMTIALAGS